MIGNKAPEAVTGLTIAQERTGHDEAWHQELVEEVAIRAEIRAEELEKRFRERMETSLSFELAKVEHMKRRAAGFQSKRLDATHTVLATSSAPEAVQEESFRQLYDLRQRYQRLQVATPLRAEMSSEDVRQRLSTFYAKMCPSKLGSIARIVASFEARGATPKALRDLNSELLATYGCDLYTFVESDDPVMESTNSRKSPHRLALKERLAMLSEDARHSNLIFDQSANVYPQIQHDSVHVSSDSKPFYPLQFNAHVSQPQTAEQAQHSQPSPQLIYPSQTQPPNQHEVKHSQAENSAHVQNSEPNLACQGASSPRWAGESP